MCSCLSLSDSNCTDKKQNTGIFYGSNDLAIALIANVPSTCCKSGISVQIRVPGQSSQEPDFTGVWH